MLRHFVYEELPISLGIGFNKGMGIDPPTMSSVVANNTLSNMNWLDDFSRLLRLILNIVCLMLFC